MNCTPEVRQYDILKLTTETNFWGVLNTEG